MSAAPEMKKRFELSGKRKKHEPCEAIPLKWPQGSTNDVKKARLDLFDAWHDVGMQIVHLAHDDFRLLAAARKVLMFSSGEIIASNRELAWRAGHCSDKTITRCIQRYADLGIFIVASGWRRDGDGLLKTRTIRLALPVTIDDRVELPENPAFGWDTRGPSPYGHPWSRPANELKDTRGLGLTDTRGPISRDTRKNSREDGLEDGTAEPHSEPEAR